MIITCPTFVARVTAMQEAALGPLQRAQCRVHLLYCRDCQRYLQQMEQITAAARVEQPPEEPDAAKLDALKKLLPPRS